MYMKNKIKNITKILIFAIITLIPWVFWKLSTNICKINSDGITIGHNVQNFACDTVTFVLFISAIGVLLFSIGIIGALLKNKHLLYYKKIVSAYILFLLITPLIIWISFSLTYYQKAVYLGGITINSCSQGKTIYPWSKYNENNSKEKYTNFCYSIHNQKDKFNK